MTDYKIYWDQGQGSGLTLLTQGIGVVNTFTTVGTVDGATLVDGQRYKFKDTLFVSFIFEGFYK